MRKVACILVLLLAILFLYSVAQAEPNINVNKNFNLNNTDVDVNTTNTNTNVGIYNQDQRQMQGQIQSQGQGQGQGQSITVHGTTMPYLFPDYPQLPIPGVIGTPFTGPYNGQWNSASTNFLVLYKASWTKEDVVRMGDTVDAKGKVEVAMVDKPFATGKADRVDVISKKMTVEEIIKDYVVVASIDVYADTKKNVSFNSLFLSAMQKNLEDVGAPVLIITSYGFSHGSKAGGFNIGLGGGVSVVESGYGRWAGSVAPGVGFGSVSHIPAAFPYINILAVRPKTMPVVTEPPKLTYNPLSDISPQ